MLLCTIMLLFGTMLSMDSLEKTVNDIKTRDRGGYGQFYERRPDGCGAPLPVVLRTPRQGAP